MYLCLIFPDTVPFKPYHAAESKESQHDVSPLDLGVFSVVEHRQGEKRRQRGVAEDTCHLGEVHRPNKTAPNTAAGDGETRNREWL